MVDFLLFFIVYDLNSSLSCVVNSGIHSVNRLSWSLVFFDKLRQELAQARVLVGDKTLNNERIELDKLSH